MDARLRLVDRSIPRNHFLALTKVDEVLEIPTHNSAAFAASVGENYVLAEAWRPSGSPGADPQGRVPDSTAA
jgi:hypothetical protein